VDDFTLHVGDVREILATLPSDSADCVVTSPPYFGLRDYGDERQLGLEETPEEYVENLVAVFREVRRVLMPHGVVWLNLGDSYRDKELLGVPWRTALALQADRWKVRSDVIWSKRNPIPESASDRPTGAHEYVFMLSARSRYYYDQEAVREPAVWARWGDQTVPKHDGTPTAAGWIGPKPKEELEALAQRGRNARSVWEIPTESYPGAHFAVMPEELARRCLLAGCPKQVCRTCKEPRARIVASETEFWSGSGRSGRLPTGKQDQRGGGRRDVGGGFDVRMGPVTSTRTVGWTDCGHDDYRPGVVLDPFLGSGTTAVVALRHHRQCVGVELNAGYADLCRERTGRWWANPPRPVEVPEGQATLFE